MTVVGRKKEWNGSFNLSKCTKQKTFLCHSFKVTFCLWTTVAISDRNHMNPLTIATTVLFIQTLDPQIHSNTNYLLIIALNRFLLLLSSSHFFLNTWIKKFSNTTIILSVWHWSLLELHFFASFLFIYYFISFIFVLGIEHRIVPEDENSKFKYLSV